MAATEFFNVRDRNWVIDARESLMLGKRPLGGSILKTSKDRRLGKRRQSKFLTWSRDRSEFPVPNIASSLTRFGKEKGRLGSSPPENFVNSTFS